MRQLLSYAVGYPTEEKMDAVMDSYAERPRRLVGFEDDEARLVGVVGFEAASGVVAIHHIAVDDDQRRGGLGRYMLEWVAREHHSAARIELETDADAVDFYRRCGFTADRFTDPRWPEVERYRCTLMLAAVAFEASA